MSRPMDELQQLLKNLHLSRMADTLPEELQRAEKEGLAYTELLLRLVRAQWHHRQDCPGRASTRPGCLNAGAGNVSLQSRPRNKRGMMGLAETTSSHRHHSVSSAPRGGESGLARALLRRSKRLPRLSSRPRISSRHVARWRIAPPASPRRLARVLLFMREMAISPCGPQSNILSSAHGRRYVGAPEYTNESDYEMFNFLGNKQDSPQSHSMRQQARPSRSRPSSRTRVTRTPPLPAEIAVPLTEVGRRSVDTFSRVSGDEASFRSVPDHSPGCSSTGHSCDVAVQFSRRRERGTE